MLTSRVSHRIPKSCVPLLAGMVALVVALTVTWVQPPAADIHDEFANLLVADTFAQGRATNPTHAHWQHFESFHICQQPTNYGKYQPAQGAIMAIGQFLGHPAIGICLSTALAVFAITWMLAACLPNRWLILVAAVLAIHPGLQFVWGQSYWGGAMPFAGAALVYGAALRLIRSPRWLDGFVLALGITLLAFSRPMEGLAAILVAVVLLSIQFVFSRRSETDAHGATLRAWRQAFLWRLSVPLATVGILAVGVMAWYNWSLTGSPKQLPYQIYEHEYAVVPIFFWMEPNSMPEYRHREMRRFYEWDLAEFKKQTASTGTIFFNKLEKLDEARAFFVGWLAVFLVALPWAVRRREMLILLLGFPCVLLASSLTPWGFPHYFATAAPLAILLVAISIRHSRLLVRRVPILKQATIPIVLLICLFGSVNAATQHFQLLGQGWQWQRQRVAQDLERDSGKDLVFVRYSEDHNCHNEWVYNDADIDSSEIVWAREISPDADKQLIEYFADRKVWLLHADDPRPIPAAHPLVTDETLSQR